MVELMTAAVSAAIGVALALALSQLVLRGVRAALLAHEPLSGEHTDSTGYERSLWTPGEAELLPAWAGLLASALLAAAAFALASWPLWPALLAWVFAVGWELACWQRVAVSVKFVSWRRGWKRSTRRAAISALSEVMIVERRKSERLPGWCQPPACRLVLMLKSGKAVKLPSTGGWFGGEERVENVANFIRLQMDVVADNRRRAVADKRAARRRAMQPMEPVHPAAKVNPNALPRMG